MTRDLSAAGREVLDNPIAPPPPISSLERRVTRRRVARVATAGATVLALVLLTVAVAAATTGDKHGARVITAAPSTLAPPETLAPTVPAGVRTTVPPPTATPKTVPAPPVSGPSVPPATAPPTIPAVDQSANVVVPALIGLDLTSAPASLAHLGLAVTVQHAAAPGNDGRVVGQFPAAGTVMARGTAVRLRVGFDPVKLTLTQARAKWAAQVATTYSFDFFLQCECASVAPVRITVSGGRIVSVVALDATQHPSTDPRDYPTVEGEFDAIAKSQTDPGSTVTATYEPTTGAPAYIEFGCTDHNLYDCGSSVELDNIQIGG